MRNSQASALGVSLVACAACVTLAVLALHHRTLDSEPAHRQQIPQDIRLLRDTIARTTDLTERFDDAGDAPLSQAAFLLHVQQGRDRTCCSPCIRHSTDQRITSPPCRARRRDEQSPS